ncbi:MAG: hypothetical protein K8S18_06420 [Desulfobacula sp.]|nr:hypothetical protein [Desulfobacula sp.]
MKKTLINCFLFFFFFVQLQYLEAQIDKEVNRIYIWDVTLSMKGVGGTQNIWEVVKKRMIDDIKHIPDDEGILTILPFQEKLIKPVFSQSTSIEGKRKAIDFVKDFDTNTKTYTNICGAWDSAFNYIATDKINLVYLFTDGQHNDQNSGYSEDCLSDLATQWCRLAERTESCYGIYITLKKEANLSEQLKNDICEQCPEYFICQEGVKNIVNIKSNFKEFHLDLNNTKLTQTLSFDVIGTLPEDFKYKIEIQQNDFLSLADTPYYKISLAGRTEVDFVRHHNYNEAERIDQKLKLYFECDSYKNYIIQFIPATININASFQPKRTVTIKLKDEQ